MSETTDWDALRLMRIHGKKPSLPIIVTTNPKLPYRLEGVGVLVILHKAGEAMPFKLLDGLDVIFMLDRCELSIKVFKMAQSHGVTMGRVRSWCRCASTLTVAPMCCQSHRNAMEWLETPHATA